MNRSCNMQCTANTNAAVVSRGCWSDMRLHENGLLKLLWPVGPWLLLLCLRLRMLLLLLLLPGVPGHESIFDRRLKEGGPFVPLWEAVDVERQRGGTNVGRELVWL